MKYIGSGAFADCGLTGELRLPNSIEEITTRAFEHCSNFYGELRLPDNLKNLEFEAFTGCMNLRGNLVIPRKLTNIAAGAFQYCNFGGTLTLHDGITEIGERAFVGCGFKGELVLPKNLTTISPWAFSANSFSGTLLLPADLRNIAEWAFAYNGRLSGTLEIPVGVISIGAYAFNGCQGLEKIILPPDLESVKEEAFSNCFGLGSIVCRSNLPAHVGSGAFDGVAKDNLTLEVPETAVADYQTAPGWNDFKRIAAHHELVCRPARVCALHTEHHQRLIINAESDWEVESMPSWCELSQTSGSKKTELTLTIAARAKNSPKREGDIVFRLKDKDYTHRCHVTQIGYNYDEDEWLELQTASRGNRGGINIVVLGDGYDAEAIASGAYLADMRAAAEHFFAIEPYKTYRQYFNVATAMALSTETGVGSVNTIRYNRFSTTFTGGVGLQCDEEVAVDYILRSPQVNADNLDQTLLILVPNSEDYGGVTTMWTSGFAIAFCPKSTDDYPYDFRGVVQHEAGGHGFGKLGDEYIYWNEFAPEPVKNAIRAAKALGWYDNLSLTGKMNRVDWSHLIFDPRYSDIVNIYEGGYMYTRDIFRSEQNSCMNNNIPYYSTISRESIVKRIKLYAGEPYDFEDFAANDKRSATESRAAQAAGGASLAAPPASHTAPRIIQGSPLARKKPRKH